MDRCNFSILLAAWNSNVKSAVTYGLCFGLQEMDFSCHHPSLDFDVLVVNLAKERFSWGANFKAEKNAAKWSRCIYLRIRLHQHQPGGEPQAENDDFLCCHVPRKLSPCLAVDGRDLV